MSNEKIERLDVTAFGDRVRLREQVIVWLLKYWEAPQQTELAMYLKLTLEWRNKCVFSILEVLGRSLKV